MTEEEESKKTHSSYGGFTRFELELEVLPMSNPKSYPYPLTRP
jgi:mediator of RNA polymerase II transcription subunit 31